MIVEPKREILLGPLLQAGLRRSWAARDHFLRLAIVPAAVMLSIAVPLERAKYDALVASRPNEIPAGMPLIALLSIGYFAALNVFAVNWLRQLTLGEKAAPGVGLSLSRRHLRFFFLMMATSFGSGMLGGVLVLVFAGFGMPGIMAASLASLLLWAALIVRISPSWIGIALDAPMPLRIAWQRTAGQGFKLLVALLAVEMPLIMVQHLVDTVFGLTGLAMAVPMTYTLIAAAIQLVGLAVSLAILVTAFPHFLRETV